MAYSALSISAKMAPGPDDRQEPAAPDKSHEDSSNTDSSFNADTSVDVASTVIETNTNDVLTVANTNCETASAADKQEEPTTVLTLNERELQALLDEVITYTGSTRDREGKSSLFKELLQQTEVDETDEGRRVVASSRSIPGSNRTRQHKRDSVSERLTHGGSLQNLAQSINSEFDSSFAYLTSGSSHTYGGGRRKNKKHTGPSVSARQREGGSLPSNVNASHTLASLVNLDFIFDKKRRFCEDRAPVCDWTNKEKSKSLDKPSYGCTSRKDDVDKDVEVVTTAETSEADKKLLKSKQTTHEMLESDNPPPDYKPDYMVIDIEVNGLNETNVTSSTTPVTSQQLSHDVVDGEEDEGTEMKIIEPRGRLQSISRTAFDTVETPVDSAIEFPLCDHAVKQQDKGKITINGTLQLTTYNNAKCVGNGTATSPQSKVTGPGLVPVMLNGPQPNIAMAVSRLTSQTTTGREYLVSIDKKSLDENGNAVQGHNATGERKKTRRKHTQEPNVIVYKAENVEGHRNEDIDSLINFIENKESKGKKGGGKPSGNSVKVKSATGTKPRSREKDSKREQMPAKLHKSNSLEEISKTKLEDLTAEKSSSSSGTSSISSQHGAINGPLRRAKQRSTGDSAANCRGDRRSWGTEEGQSIYCHDIGDDYSGNITRRNSNRKVNTDVEHEPEFLVVTKKKKSKRQPRSSSGSRAPNLARSATYLPRSRDFVSEYRRPLSPELRRKSASSMPPSDKSDSSDLDSVHSLPVTSNTKHNLMKSGTSCGGTPQVSYADIARMATINVSPSSVLNISSIVPNMLNSGSWPTVPGKSPSEPDKFPQDYYPSLDELQQSDRKLRQNNFTNSNHVSQTFSLSFDKSSSPTNSKNKTASETAKKAEAREEAINKKIQVIKYVQEQKNLNANVNYTTNNQIDNSTNVNSTTTTTSTTTATIVPKLKNSGNNNSLDEINNVETLCIKDGNANVKIAANYQRSTRRNYQQTPQNPINNTVESTKKSSNVQEDVKKPTNACADECNKKSAGMDVYPTNNPAGNPVGHHPTSEADTISKVKAEKPVKIIAKDTQPSNTNASSQDTSARTISLKSKDSEVEQKKPNKLINTTKSDWQLLTKKNPRPAVILMDESLTDIARNSESPSELMFGFEVNEQLLQSDEKTVEEPAALMQLNQIMKKPPINCDRMVRAPALDKHVRYEKFPPIFQSHTAAAAAAAAPPPPPPLPPTYPYQLHQFPHPQMMVPYLGYAQRFPPPNAYISPIPPPPTANINEKSSYRHQTKDDLSVRYVAPEAAVNVRNYNHDKIVAWVGEAWEEIMREIPETASTGRVQYYSGQ